MGPSMTLFPYILVHFGTNVFISYFWLLSRKIYKEFQDFSATGTSTPNLPGRGAKRNVIMALLFHAVNNQTPSFSLQFRVRKDWTRVLMKPFQKIRPSGKSHTYRISRIRVFLVVAFYDKMVEFQEVLSSGRIRKSIQTKGGFVDVLPRFRPHHLHHPVPADQIDQVLVFFI